jgi:hypothetical protein
MGAYYKGTWGASSATGYHAIVEVVARKARSSSWVARATEEEVESAMRRRPEAMFGLSTPVLTSPAAYYGRKQ